MIILLTDSFLKLQKLERAKYFLPQINVVNSEGLHDFEIVWSQDKPLEEAASDIKDKILESPTPVTLLAHGKGGVDAIECLIQNPELQDKVEKLIVLQAPVWGTPLADFLTGHPIMGLITTVACKLMGCSVKAIEELSELNRQVYMIVNKNKIRELLENVPVVSVGTTLDMPSGTKIMKRAQALVNKHAGPNDGLVPLMSMRISNEPHLELQNVAHAETVTSDNSAAPEIENLTRDILNSAKPSRLPEYPAKFPWGPFEANSDSKRGHPYQSEIS